MTPLGAGREPRREVHASGPRNHGSALRSALQKEPVAVDFTECGGSYIICDRWPARYVALTMPLAASTEGRHRTKQEFVCQTLRQAILSCELRPGERLVIDDLARRLLVSIIPVREALQVLHAEGLVLTVPHVGATVAPVSRESILDVFTVLEGLEVVATRLVAERRSRDALATLGRLVATMDEVVAAGRLEEWADLNTPFHQAISTSSGLPLLAEMTGRVLGRWD